MINQAEYDDAVGRVEYYYWWDSPYERPKRETKVDSAGYVEWMWSYKQLRESGMPHEQAIQQVLNTIRSIEFPAEPPQPTTRHPIVGQLKCTVDGFFDDNGPVLVAMCHYGSAFSDYTRHPDKVRQQLDKIAEADYHGIRFWDTLGYYAGGWKGKEVSPIDFKNDRGEMVVKTPNYYDQLQAFLVELKDRQLVAHHSRGDLNSWSESDILAHCAHVGTIQRVVGLQTIALNEACNEAQLNIQNYSVEFLTKMIQRINNPSILSATSDVSQNEDTNTLVKYALSVCYIHGYRGGDHDPVGQIRHIHSLRYDGGVKVSNKAGYQGEPAGRGMSGPQVTRPDTLVLMAMQAWCCRQAWTYASGSGVWGDTPIENEPAFREVVKARAWLPKDCMSYPDAFHGGDTWAAKRVIRANDPQGLCRADHRMKGNLFTITIHAKPGRVWNLVVDRSFTAVAIDPLNGPGAEFTMAKGSVLTFNGTDRTGVVLVGKVI